MFRSLSKILTASLLGLLIVSLTSPLAHARVSPDSMEKEIGVLTNRSRAAHDLPPLKAQACLQRFAQKQANAQAGKQTMYHQDLQPVLRRCSMSFVGENVAWGYTSSKSVQRAWMNSPGHRANILHRKFKLVGVGVATARDGSLYYAVVFGRAR